MKKTVCLVTGIVCLVTAGCQTTTPGTGANAEIAEATSSSQAIGKSAQAMIDAAGGQKVQIFDETGKEVPKLPELPPKTTGSVSIHAVDGTGQDNYTFNGEHIITKHMRSYGEDYSAGKWEEVK